jgi:uncharacterized membrane protein YbhN (UPF0104 family)
LLRLALTIAALIYLFWRADAGQVAKALVRIPVHALLGAVICTLLAMLTGILRWRVLLLSYGAHTTPPARDLVRWYFASILYNLLPGSVGGDMMRGIATRTSFREHGALSSLSVVLIERILGLAGLLVLTAIASCFSPFAGPEVLKYSVAGLALAASAVVGLGFAKHLARWMPRRIAAQLLALPSLVRPSGFVAAALWSVAAHLLIASSGHLLINGLTTLSWIDSFVIFPLTTLAAFFPLTVAGAGARDTALVLLLGRVGVPEADALACSLALLFCNLAMAAIGAVLGQPASTSTPADQEPAALNRALLRASPASPRDRE